MFIGQTGSIWLSLMLSAINMFNHVLFCFFGKKFPSCASLCEVAKKERGSLLFFSHSSVEARHFLALT